MTLSGPYSPARPLPFFGVIRPGKVADALREKRLAKSKMFEAAITRLLSIPDFETASKPPAGASARRREIDPGKDYLAIKGRLIELDEELREAIEDSRGIPGGILVKGSDLGAGASALELSDILEEDEVAEATEGGVKYDEWDYRRGGYRAGWCSLFEHDVHQDDDPFVERTLAKYGGYVQVLKRQFESLRRAPRLLRKQRDGEDIDIDAAVEAFCDTRAGLSPGEDIFVKLDRTERDVAALFLLDMSGSTKGWINEAEKESLVLLCEALESLGDRYAIYGFSGMTRNRCEFYRIKSFADAYAGAVKGRIAGITPRDYTRMGTPIRHATGILSSVEARTRLLIALSDGRPEDYDAYKGDYGMEDTRRALAEARELGIHAFCVTIDREASEYLPRMFGETGYVFIDDVRKLPGRITGIYRTLTT
jgi:nitric oxide reductase NorD protein